MSIYRQHINLITNIKILTTHIQHIISFDAYIILGNKCDENYRF